MNVQFEDMGEERDGRSHSLMHFPEPDNVTGKSKDFFSMR